MSEHTHTHGSDESGGATASQYEEYPPEVRLDPTDGRESYVNTTTFVVSRGGWPVGEAVMLRPTTGDVYLTRLQLAREVQEGGVAIAALLRARDLAHAEGRGLRTDPMGEYRAATDAWNALATAGTAEVVSPLRQESGPRGTGTASASGLYKGHLRIGAPE